MKQIFLGKVGKVIAIGAGMVAILTFIGGAWVFMDGPLPASASSVLKIEKQIVDVGVEYYLDKQDRLNSTRYEWTKKHKRLERKLKRLERAEPNNIMQQQEVQDDLDSVRQTLDRLDRDDLRIDKKIDQYENRKLELERR